MPTCSGVDFTNIAAVLFTALLFCAAARSAHLQRAEMKRRERVERPNLQLYDVAPERMGAGDPPRLFGRKLIVQLMNFGVRPARIASVLLYAHPQDEVGEIVRALDSPVVESRDRVRCEIGAAVAKWFQSAAIRALQQADPVGGGAASEPASAVLEIVYGEVDGSELRTARFAIDLNSYRPQFNLPECHYGIERAHHPVAAVGQRTYGAERT